jgi:hypothetical protein
MRFCKGCIACLTTISELQKEVKFPDDFKCAWKCNGWPSGCQEGINKENCRPYQSTNQSGLPEKNTKSSSSRSWNEINLNANPVATPQMRLLTTFYFARKAAQIRLTT